MTERDDIERLIRQDKIAAKVDAALIVVGCIALSGLAVLIATVTQ